MTKYNAYLISIIMILMLAAIPCSACTNLLVTRGASADSSVMITYTCDAEFHPTLRYNPAEDYQNDDSVEITDWSGNVLGKIPQVAHTYAVVGLMNEHQLAISETTFSGREELRNPNGLLHYWDMMMLALKRARTAREAIIVMTNLVKEYGYRSSGETFSIADTKETWIMEMIGPGPDGKGAHWVALRIPDGYISCHANKSRIGEFPLDAPDSCLYSKDVISFAIEKGYYDPDPNKPFRFCDAYCPSTPKNRRYADTRVWSIFRRAAPSKNLSPDYHRAMPNTEPYPLWIKPDSNLATSDVFDLMRDHYEGTPYDMTTGLDAGPYGTPNRWRPMTWQPDSTDTIGSEYAWERPISTQQTAFSFVSQSRDWLPDKIGGVYWYGVDDTYTSCYFPLYCGINAIPKSFTVGKLGAFSWESAWWVFNFVANYANLKYSFMLKDIQTVQSNIEETFLKLQPAVEKTALELAQSDKELMARYLTDYSVTHAEQVVNRWKALAEHLLTKYNDGYVKDIKGHPQQRGYPESWLNEVLKARPNQFRLPRADTTVSESKLVD
ncbi:MAG: C69 family dipeptidase [candidate division Zixibacteria bacterium]|nr:C69 family dipeptidase [candidate division Zixibacteria bacterium]